LDEVLQQKKYLFKALDLSKKIHNKRVESKCYNIYANLLIDENKTDSALYYYNKSLVIAKEINLKHLQAKVLSNIGSVYRDKDDYANAIIYADYSVKLNTEIGDYKFLAADYITLGWIYSEMNDLKKSKEYFLKALELSKDKFVDSEINSYKGLAFLYSKLNQFNEAFKYHVKYTSKKDSIYNFENSKQLGDIKTNFEVEKKEAELKAEQEKIQMIAVQEKKQQQIIIIGVLGLLLVVVIFSIFLFNRFKITDRQKKIIALKSQETEKQKLLVEEKQKEIIDSIRYAKRIQNAILPQALELNKYLPDNFVLYLPKDIIAGDFYWMHVSDDGKIFIAAADSTGHGVPGTIVSIVCSNALDKAVKEFKIKDTGKILDKTTELVLETFAKSGEDINDGMDISLLCIDKLNQKVFWSGANNSLLYRSPFEDFKKENVLQKIKPNKQPIGKSENQIPFKTHEIPYNEGTIFYLMTDGYQDQFGGPSGKKFKYKQLEEIILKNCNLPLHQQSEVLNHTFFTWKDNLEQVDDVTIIGIKI
jgi:serine phosphatase RsbU (regulator of sigma subunit)